MKEMGKKKKKWLKFRHRVIRNTAFFIIYPYTRLKYHVRIHKFKEQEKKPYLILFNHQTALDQFIVGSAFKGPIYYLASEDIFSNGTISRLLEWAVAPIPIKKQATDSQGRGNDCACARGKPHVQRKNRIYKARDYCAYKGVENASRILSDRGRLRGASKVERQYP